MSDLFIVPHASFDAYVAATSSERARIRGQVYTELTSALAAIPVDAQPDSFMFDAAERWRLKSALRTALIALDNLEAVAGAERKLTAVRNWEKIE